MAREGGMSIEGILVGLLAIGQTITSIDRSAYSY